MKIGIVALASAMGLAGSAQAASYVSTVEATNPIAYFRLDGTNEGSAVGGYTTTYTATTGTGTGAPLVSDPANKAATFSGTSDYATRSEVNTSLSGGIPGKGTISAWINIAAMPDTIGHIEYIAGESQNGNDFDLQIEGGNQLKLYTGGGENTATTLSNDVVGQWIMVTAAYDSTLGADSYRSIYVDGVEVANYVGGVSNGTKTLPFTIGYSDVFGGRDFDGSIDEVAVWNYALSDDQVSSIYASRLNPADAAAVPEPATWAMMLGGFGLVGGAMRRRRAATITAVAFA